MQCAEFNQAVTAACAGHPEEHFTCSACGVTWCAWWTEQYEQCAACGAQKEG